jgi:hypothetical protein
MWAWPSRGDPVGLTECLRADRRVDPNVKRTWCMCSLTLIRTIVRNPDFLVGSPAVNNACLSSDWVEAVGSCESL